MDGAQLDVRRNNELHRTRPYPPGLPVIQPEMEELPEPHNVSVRQDSPNRVLLRRNPRGGRGGAGHNPRNQGTDSSLPHHALCCKVFIRHKNLPKYWYEIVRLRRGQSSGSIDFNRLRRFFSDKPRQQFIIQRLTRLFSGRLHPTSRWCSVSTPAPTPWW